MLINASCTVYKADKSGGFLRHYIPECFWIDTKSDAISSGGFSDQSAITVYIPMNYAEMAPDHAQKDMIVYGKCDLEFDNSSPKSISESLNKLRKTTPIHTVTGISKKPYGNALKHIKVVAG